MAIENLDAYLRQWVSVTWVPADREIRNPDNRITRTGMLRQDPQNPDLFHLRMKRRGVKMNLMIHRSRIISISLLRFQGELEEVEGEEVEFTPGDEVQVDE